MRYFLKLFIHQKTRKIITGNNKKKKIVFKIDNTVNQHIRMISGESCDTEDWSNNVQNSALITEIHYILKYITTEKHYFKL